MPGESFPRQSDEGDDAFEGKNLEPARVLVQQPRRAIKDSARRFKKVAANPECPEEGRLGRTTQLTESPELRPQGVIVGPEMPTYSVVSVMSKMDMSRDEKAVYLGRAGFTPKAISAILALVDGYTEASEV